jgi:hypothetical protein
VDRVTGKTLIRSVVVGEVGTHDAERIAAVRAIDLLRASFRELEEHPAPPEAEVRPSLPVRRAIRPAAPRFAIGVGPSVAGAAGGLGATAHAAIALQFMPHRIFGIGLRAFVPIVGARVEAPEGVARVHIGWLTVGPRFAFVRADRRLQPSVGLSAGAVFVGMRGEARPPFAGRSDRVIAAMLELDAALSIAVHSRIRIWLDASIGVAMPRVGVRIAGRRVAAWGWPAGTGVAGIQLVF